jgi:intracellular multiplication protein IcmT
MLDARVSVAILFFLLHIRLWTFVTTLLIIAVFYWVERFGYDFPSSMRAARLYFAGRIRPTAPRNKLRFPIDYDRRPLF